MTTTTLDDLDPALRAIATAWEVRTGPDGAWLVAGDPARPAIRLARRRRRRARHVSAPRRRPMVRLGDLIPDAARALGLEDELRLARAIATFEALVAERVPAAAGACRVIRLEGFALDVEADAPIVAQELRLRGTELLAAFAAAPGGVGARELRVHVRRVRSPRIIRRHLPATLGATVRGPRKPSPIGASSVLRPRSGDPPQHERPGWPSDST